MIYLLDTHTFLWWLDGDSALSVTAKRAIADDSNDVFVSAASAWEIATKHRLGKLPGAAEIVTDIEGAIAGLSFIALPIKVVHGQAAGELPGPHRDPFDRMLIAQAMIERLVLVTNEHTFNSYGVARLW